MWIRVFSTIILFINENLRHLTAVSVKARKKNGLWVCPWWA
jgi:hypothetical protein